MKKIIIATIIGLMASGSVFAAGEYKNQEQREDQLQGYGKTKTSASEPATVRVGRANNEQQEDAVYGYKK